MHEWGMVAEFEQLSGKFGMPAEQIRRATTPTDQLGFEIDGAVGRHVSVGQLNTKQSAKAHKVLQGLIKDSNSWSECADKIVNTFGGDGKITAVLLDSKGNVVARGKEALPDEVKNPSKCKSR